MVQPAVMYAKDLDRMVDFYAALGLDISDPPQAREQTPIKLVFVVPSIEDALQATGLLGGRIKDGAKRWQFRGHAVQDAVDPEGNVYQLREHQ